MYERYQLKQITHFQRCFTSIFELVAYLITVCFISLFYYILQLLKIFLFP